MLNKLKIEVDDDELQELKDLVAKILKGQGEISVRLNGTLRGLAKVLEKELNIYDDFKKRDMW